MKADQKVRTHPDAFPTEEQDEVVGTKYEEQHREDEQIQVGEEFVVAFVVAHIAHRKKMNE